MKKGPRASFFQCGFSVLELAVIIVIIGVLAIMASGRISGSLVQTRAFYDELLSQVQYARKVAIAQRRAVFVRIEAAQSRVCYTKDGTCTGTDGVTSAKGDLPFTVGVPSGVAVTAATFQFDALGRYRDMNGGATSAPLVLSVAGDGNYQLTVEHETGYAR